MTPERPDAHPDLFALLRGELTNVETTVAGDHLRDCPACRDDLVDSVVGHALLTRAAGALGRLGADEPVLPPLALPARARHRRPLRLLAAAAALVVGAGAATTLALTRDDSDPAATTSAAVTAGLGPLDGAGDADRDGQVRMVAERGRQTRMTITVHGLPVTEGGDYYYAWLLDPATDKMLPLGRIGPTGSASFDLGDDVVSAYSAVDVSLEADDGDPGHSVTSVLRGGYDPGATPS